jgi:hypothetical protein
MNNIEVEIVFAYLILLWKSDDDEVHGFAFGRSFNAFLDIPNFL